MSEKKLIILSKKYREETSVVQARVPCDLIKKIDNVAKNTGRTRNEVIQMCLEFALDSIEISDS